MIVIEKMFNISSALKRKGKTVGLVPTMGYLHKGHESLLVRAREECNKAVMSIFVNPLQFGPNEDYERYPRDFEGDYKIAKSNGIDYIFYPKAADMYTENFKTFVEVKKLGDVMCGKYRQGHFRGVCTVVLKLFNIIYPDKAYFGQKDYQQLLIIKKMVEDLNLKIEIVSCPTIRDEDGLALSSRNKYLTLEERKNAPEIFKCLNIAAELLKKGEKDLKEIRKKILNKLSANKFITRVEYFDFRDAENLDEIKDINDFYGKKYGGKILIAAAIWIGNTRLIDNILFQL